MNKALLIAASLIASGAVAATAQTQAAPADEKEAGQPKMICRTQTEIGSRLNRRRVCRTQAQWDEIEAQTRQVVERVQSFKQTSGN